VITSIIIDYLTGMEAMFCRLFRHDEFRALGRDQGRNSAGAKTLLR
jgi:hypothetical protein